MEQDRLPCAGPGQKVMDREAFERVWRRVMPEDRPDCPFTLYSDETLEEEVLIPPAPARTAAAGEVCAPPARMSPASPAACAPGAMLPAAPARRMEAAAEEMPAAENDVPCLGCASAVHGKMLQAFIADEVADWRLYQGLSRRAPGNAGRTLRAMGEDERRHAKRLSTAYFLISGVQFWPDRQPAAPAGTWMGVLRARFAAEQRGEAAYRAAAAQTVDPCLRELFLELAGDEAEHTWLLRGILEQM